jgi:predicted glycosyltransferase involved in capsule biosynthesis
MKRILENKVEIKDMTICIPIRIDSESRKRNLSSLLAFFSRYVDAPVLVIEADKQSLAGNLEFDKNCRYVFIEDKDTVFYRTNYINRMFYMITTPFAAVWDCDVVAYPHQIMAARDCLKNQNLTLVYPYIGFFIYMNPYLSEIFHRTKELQLMDVADIKKRLFHGYEAVGGAYLVNVEKYLSIGGENENFYGWGPEDGEREKRVEILEAGMARVEGMLFHLYHARGAGSYFPSEEIQLRSMREFCKVCSMTKEELLEYVNTCLVPLCKQGKSLLP